MDVSLSVLNGLKSKQENLLVDLTGQSEDEPSFDFLKSRLLQEDRRQAS